MAFGLAVEIGVAMRLGVLVLGWMLVGLIVVPGVASAGEPPGVAVSTSSDGEDVIEVAVDDDGAFTGNVTVTNSSEADFELSATGQGMKPVGCSVTVTPDQVPAHRTVTLAVSAKHCKLGDESTATLVFASTSGAGGTVTVPLAAEEKEEGVSVGALLPPFGTAAILGLVLVLLLRIFGYSNQKVQKVDQATGSPVWMPDTSPRVPDTEDLKLTTPVTGMPAGWTFKDSWASNLSVGATVFIALFGSKDVLDAIFGKAPEGSVARLLIAGAIAALFVGLAPLVLKTIGESTVPTVGGLLAAAFFTMVGVIGQILATAWIFTTDTPDDGPGWLPSYIVDSDNLLVSVLAVALIGFLLFYGYWTIHVLLVEAFPAPKKEAPTPVADELLYAAAIAGVPDWGDATLGERLEAAKEAAKTVAEAAAAEAEAAVAGGFATPEQRQLMGELAQLRLAPVQSRRLYSGIL